MSLTLPVWLLLAFAVTTSALLIFPLLSDETRGSLFSRLRSSGWPFGQTPRSGTGMPVVAATVFLLVAGVGVVVSYVGGSSEATGSGRPKAFSEAHSGPSGDVVTSLKDYTRSIGAEQPAPAAADGKPLPDVNTMIERLAARLQTTPGDLKGWRMLGWSYFHTGRYGQAAAALAKAVELDPSSSELKLAYETAKARASASDSAGTGSPSSAEAGGKGADRSSAEKNAKSEATPQREYDAAIRGMVDGLAARLESSPRDVEGWAHLMRSRVVLGEREVAATALRRALEVFKDDPAATGRIAAAATELGLKAE